MGGRNMFTLFIQAYTNYDYTSTNRAIVEDFMNADAGRDKAAHLAGKFNLTSQDVHMALFKATKMHAYFTKDLAADLLTKAENYADKFVANKGANVTAKNFDWTVECVARAYADENLTRDNRTLADLVANTAEDAVEKAYTNADSYNTLHALDKVTDALRNCVARLMREGHTDKATRFLDTFKAKVDESADNLKNMHAFEAHRTIDALIRAAEDEVRKA